MREQLYYVGVFILAIWLVFIVDCFVGVYDLTQWGVQPRRMFGIVGIPLMPFLHADYGHLFGNTVSLGILLFLLVGSERKPWPIIAAIIVLSGVLVWLLGWTDTNHIGASGLVFGLIGFMILNGILTKRLVSIGITLVVGFLFGGTLIWGLIPQSGVSFAGHLFGFLSGGVVAYFLSERSQSTRALF